MSTSRTSNRRVLVTGASVAGPAAAYWLDRTGWDVTVLERAPELRTAGQNIDVRGQAREVLDRMGLLEAVRDANTGEVGTRFVSEDGSTLSEFPAGEGEGDGDGPTAELEILRGELARVLTEACDDRVEWRFGDSIAAVEQTADDVAVTFESGRTERYSLVVDCEGPSSRTRDLVLAEHERPQLRRLGLCIAYATIPRADDDSAWWEWWSAPGSRTLGLRPDNLGTTRAMLSVMHDRPVDFRAMDEAGRRAWFRERFADLGWQAPRILAEMATTDEFYVEDLTQVVGGTWTTGRVVMLGDAAWCVTPIGGGGTSLALIGAYVLAVELSRLAPGADPAPALEQYVAYMRPLVDRAQKLPPGAPRAVHPRSRVGVAVLQTAIKVAGSTPVQALTGKITVSPGADTPLPDLF